MENQGSKTERAEDGQIADAIVSIRNAVNVGAADGVYIVHLGAATFQLAPPEADAFRATFAGEESFRGKLATTFIELAGIYGRMLVAYEEFKEVRSSTFLWQPKAEALKALLPRAAHALETSEPVFTTAKQRGLVEKISALHASRERLQTLIADVQVALKSHA